MNTASLSSGSEHIGQDFRGGSELPAAAPRMLADVLWEAANKHLRSQDDWDEHGVSKFTCDAVAMALGERGAYSRAACVTRAIAFLCRIGLTSTYSLDLFSKFSPGEERQGVRYMWLLLAMHVAADEGLTA